MKNTTKAPQSNFIEEGEKYIQEIYQKVPPQDKGTVERAVAAGGKVMFSEQTHKYMQDILNSEGDMADKLGIGIVQLMLLMHQQTKGKIPLNAWSPAASILLMRAMEFIEKTDGGMSMAIFSDALQVMIAGLKKKVMELTGQGKPEQAPPQEPQAQQAPQPTAQGGLIGAQQSQGV